MATKKILLTLPYSWPEELQRIATTQLPQSTTVNQLIRLAIEAQYGLQMDWTDFDYRNPKLKTKAKAKTPAAPTTKASLQTDLPRRMEWVLKAIAKQHNLGISSIINLLLYANLKNILPSKPEPQPLAERMWTNTPLSEAPDRYYVKVHVNLDWEEPIKQYCKENNESVSDMLSRMIMKKFGHLRVPDNEGYLPPIEDDETQTPKPATVEPNELTLATAEQYELAQQS